MKRNISDSVIESILENCKDDDSGLQDFIRQFYAYLADHYKSQSGTLLCIARNLYQFSQSRTLNENRVRIFRPTVEEHGWQSGFTVIEIITDDKPFLVDSVTEELKRRQYIIHDLINSVVTCQRKNQSVKESIIYFTIPSISEAEMTDLQDEILHILEMVQCCVQDWPHMLARVDDAQKRLSKASVSKEEIAEIGDFLIWLKNDNFVFLGYVEYNWSDSQNIIRDDSALLGAAKIDTALYDLNVCKEESHAIYITRSDRMSKVHRAVNMDCIGVRNYDAKGNIIGEIRFLGLFTSILYFQDVRLIPIIRQKIKYVEQCSKFSKSSHNHKALIAVLQDFPRAELLHLPQEELYHTSMGILSLSVRSEVKLFVHIDQIGYFARFIIFVPRRQFSTVLWFKMQAFLAKAFEGVVVNEQIRDSGLVRLQLIMKIESVQHDINMGQLELQLKEMARDWSEDLKEVLHERLDYSIADKLYKKYENSFPVSYQEAFKLPAAFYDIQRIEKVCANNSVEADLYCDHHKNYQLKVYLPAQQIELFDMLPVIENMAMKTTNHYSYAVNVGNDIPVLIHHFTISINIANLVLTDDIKEQFELTLRKIWDKKIGNDYYNSLVLVAGLKWREVLLLRAFGSYLKQIRFNYGDIYIQQALFNHSKIVALLVALFHAKLDPAVSNDERTNKVDTICQELEGHVGAINSLADDKIIRALMEVIMAIMRTNYYYDKDYASFKINSQALQNIPLPKPYVEIYVYSHDFEAIHLRGGKVARGGLRWSDRTEDFRTEVLGLLKAQMPKNIIIVPVGSKGGFIVKSNNKDRKNVIGCYQHFLRAMLDVTDNIVNTTTLEHPENMVLYDGDDPYLVVAADKGTATFSDHANAVAAEYNFWLGDAFASGGSSGYDHKTMSITSKGAWVSTLTHLWALGLDSKKELLVVGIGDMAGDVFGNGLLRSEKLKLIFAFNHMHIFIDPNPDAKTSFIERKRLFNLPQSTWMDYDSQLISEGGGVFNRSAKLIKISPQMKQALDIKEDVLDPNTLIRKGLMAKVDIIWNGGIGTFIKSKVESNDVVGDKSNDYLRINGRDVRAKMVIEGGNLGCTQLGRIEYAKHGGRINTDFIDNSAGVNCSDMEVNIKIALSEAIANKKITLKERNALLVDMQEEVVKIILYNTNSLQTKSLVVAHLQGRYKLEQYHRLIQELEKEGRLNRAVEFIPNDEELNHMYAQKNALSIPEIAVIIAYAKMSLYDAILASEVPDDDYLNAYLIAYFPHGMREQFHDEIMHHRLRREIITTQLVNSIVNRMGCTFIPDVIEHTGTSIAEVVKIYVAVYHAYDLDNMWNLVDNLRDKIGTSVYLEMVTEIHKFVENVLHWFLRNYPKPINMQLTITEFSENINKITENLNQVLDQKSLEAYNDRLNKFLHYDLPENLAMKIASLQFLISAPPIVQVTNNIRFHGKMQIPLINIAKIYFMLGCHLHFSWLRRAALKLNAGTFWQRLAIKTLFDDLQDHQMKLAERVTKEIQDGEDYTDTIKRWCGTHKGLLERYENMLGDLKVLKELDVSRLVIIIKYLGEIC